jgi:hypothetical protein
VSHHNIIHSPQKKPKDKPKRPLSAYNFFFKEEREKILKILQSDDPEEEQKDSEPDDYLSPEAAERLKKEGGKVSFEEMGKLIGQRWKNIDPDRLTKYSELASEDTERYKTEMQSYNTQQEAKMRNEAMKPMPSYGQDRYDRGPPMGYPPEHMGMHYGNPYTAAQYGMDYGGGYGMGMGGYGAYGGYGAPQEGMMGGYGAGYGAYQGYGGPPPPDYGGQHMDGGYGPQHGYYPPPPPPPPPPQG